MKILVSNLIFFMILLSSFSSFAGFNGKGDNGDNGSLVVVMDVQRYFTEMKIGEDRAGVLIKNINSLQQKIVDKADMVYTKSILRVMTVKKSGVGIEMIDGLDFDDRLNIKTGNIYQKYKANAFSSDSFVEFLNKRDVKILYLVGVMTGRRIYKTACNALKKGYRVVLVREALMGMNEDLVNKIFRKLKGKGAEFVSLSEI